MLYRYINVALLWLMRLAFLISAPLLLWQGDPLGLLAIVALLVTFIPTFLRRYDINAPWWLEFLIALAFFLDVVVGSEFAVYKAITGFDWITHILGTFIISLIALSIVYSLKVTGRIRVNNGMIWFFVVVFALAVGAFYEILEFLTDIIFATNSQVDLTNTMVDMMNDLIGGIITATWGTYYLTNLQGKKMRDVLDPYIKLLKLFGVRIKEGARKIKEHKHFRPHKHG
ncbi:hypothetical protein HY493_04440 [Candidatus Woesearchaeota archaeon]|nr:hypothetical protein [Candidatus Woesearchaeota archaeon]